MSQYITDAKKALNAESTEKVDREALAKVVNAAKEIAKNVKKTIDAKKADLKDELKKVSEYELSEDEDVVNAYLEAVRDKLDETEFLVYETLTRLDD